MYKGYWLDGADRTKDVVLDTNGMVFEVTGEYEDGSVELVVAYASNGMPLDFDPERAPDVESNLDPCIVENERNAMGTGFLGDSFPPAGLGSVGPRRALAR